MIVDRDAPRHPENVKTDTALHESIVDGLRRAGWDRPDAIAEADRITSRRYEKGRKDD